MARPKKLDSRPITLRLKPHHLDAIGLKRGTHSPAEYLRMVLEPILDAAYQESTADVDFEE